MNEHSFQQFIGSLFVLIFAGLLALIGLFENHRLMKHGLYAAATWMVFVVLMRMAALFTTVSQTDARVYNGWFAGVVGAVLVSFIAADWLAKRRA